jgi:hypothetical protein
MWKSSKTSITLKKYRQLQKIKLAVSICIQKNLKNIIFLRKIKHFSTIPTKIATYKKAYNKINLTIIHLLYILLLTKE